LLENDTRVPLNCTKSVLVTPLIWNTKFYQQYFVCDSFFFCPIVTVQYAVKISQSFFWHIRHTHNRVSQTAEATNTEK